MAFSPNRRRRGTRVPEIPAGASCEGAQSPAGTPSVFPKVRPTFLTFLSWAQLVRGDPDMLMLRVAAVVTLQVYTAAFLRASIELSIGAFIDI